MEKNRTEEATRVASGDLAERILRELEMPEQCAVQKMMSQSLDKGLRQAAVGGLMG